MRVVVVPVLSDNYAYLLIDEGTNTAAAVDPAEASIVKAKADAEGVTITQVYTTHHHGDHAGGNAALASKIPGLKVYGGAPDNVSACTNPLNHEDTFSLGSIQVKALLTPGHTRGSITYYCTEGDAGLIFTGDTMFVGGCGRLFEGSYEDMYNSLANVIGKLPLETQVYVGHDYTVKNLEFGVAVETSNEKLAQMLEWAKEQKIERRYSVPSTLRTEWAINPFVRAGDDAFKSICPGCSPVEIFTRLRRQKDSF
mmetsp:Transcript_60008/g.105039  ORF Transcript_60008/g.105039 Transcript_60008/m.105039 type:complete len:254 (+) Transcript_60008:51-812(+)